MVASGLGNWGISWVLGCGWFFWYRRRQQQQQQPCMFLIFSIILKILSEIFLPLVRDSSEEVAIQVDMMELQEQHHQGAAEAIEQLEQLPEQPEGAVRGVEIDVPTGK